MEMKTPDSVTIVDVTLREYGQNVPAGYLNLFTPQIRAGIAQRLMEAGFKDLEIFSCVNPQVAPSMKKEDLK